MARKKRKVVKGGTIERLERVTTPATVMLELSCDVQLEGEDAEQDGGEFWLEPGDGLVLQYESDDAEEVAAWLRSIADAVEGE
jgi:hypothetical protein